MVEPEEHEGRLVGEKDWGLGFWKKSYVGKMVR
jgi:hypothetical protein